MTAYSIQRQNIYRSWLLMLIFMILVIFVAYVFSYALGNSSIFYGGIIFAILFNFLTYWFSDKWVMKLNGAKEVSKDEFPEIYKLIENISITAGLPSTPKLYLIESNAMNAFATGRNPKNSAVAVTRGLISKLEKRELEGVLAHEISHIKNYDTRLMVIASILAGIIAVLADIFWRMSFFGGKRDDRENGRVIIFLIAIMLAILAPIFAQLIQLAISRKREFLADSSAALLTRDPESLASALEKISKDANLLNSASPSTAHLYIVNPFRNRKDLISWLGNLFSTHPPVEERIRILRSMVL